MVRVDGAEHVLPRDAELVLHHADHLGLGHRRDRRLEGLELGDVLGRHDVGSRRQHLSELAERGTELLEGFTQPARAVGVGLASQHSSRERAKHGGPEHPHDLLRAAVVTDLDLLGLGLHHGAVDRRVHDGDGAPREVRDAVGDVAEQELAAATHAAVADHQHVGIDALGFGDDQLGDLFAPHDLDRRRIVHVRDPRGQPGGDRVALGVVIVGHHLHHVQSGVMRSGELGGPPDGPGRWFTAVRRDGDHSRRVGHDAGPTGGDTLWWADGRRMRDITWCHLSIGRARQDDTYAVRCEGGGRLTGHGIAPRPPEQAGGRAHRDPPYAKVVTSRPSVPVADQVRPS